MFCVFDRKRTQRDAAESGCACARASSHLIVLALVLDEALQASDVDLAGVVFLVALTRCDESDLVFLAAKNAATGKTPDAVETTVSHGFEWRAGVGPKVPSPLIGCSPDATLRSSGEEREWPPGKAASRAAQPRRPSGGHLPKYIY